MRAMYVIQGLPETTDRTDESRDRLEGVMERESSHPAAMTKAYPPACPAAVTRAPPLLYPAAATGEDDPRRLDRRCSRRAGDQGGGSDWARAPVRQLRAPASPPASSPSLCCPGQLLVAMDRPAPAPPAPLIDIDFRAAEHCKPLVDTKIREADSGRNKQVRIDSQQFTFACQHIIHGDRA